MRTQKEIKARTIVRVKEDLFGFEIGGYIGAMTKATAKTLVGSILKLDADIEHWVREFRNDHDIIKKCIGYMDFAWEKANNCRGLSAARSMMHYKGWLWLLGRDDFEHIEEYQFYGKDELVRICNFLGLDSKKWDDGVRSNTES